MAESADILAANGQQVILPDLNAGCSMVDMAEISQVEDCRALACALSTFRGDHTGNLYQLDRSD